MLGAQDCALPPEQPPPAADGDANAGAVGAVARPDASRVAALREDWALGVFHAIPAAAAAAAAAPQTPAQPAPAPGADLPAALGLAAGPANIAGTAGARAHLVTLRTTAGHFFSPAMRRLSEEIRDETESALPTKIWRAQVLRRQAQACRAAAQRAADESSAVHYRDQAGELDAQAAKVEAEIAAIRKRQEAVRAKAEAEARERAARQAPPAAAEQERAAPTGR